MKKSNILLIALVAFSFLALIGTGLSLKSQFDKIDRNDPYYGFKKTNLENFKYVKLSGNYLGITQIQEGTKAEILINTGKLLDGNPIIDWNIDNDTLMVNYKNENDKKFPFGQYIFSQAPNVYIILPKLSAIVSNGIPTIIQGWNTDSLTIKQKNFAVILRDNTIKHLFTQTEAGAHLVIQDKNTIDHSLINAKDSSIVKIDKDVFKTFQLETDSTVKMNIPQSVIKKMKQL